jgi:opacity protein-like surface antigen
MNAKALVASVALALISTIAPMAFAEDTSGGRWYVGGSLGATNGLDLCDSFHPSFMTTSGTCDNSKLAGKVFGGYKFNKYVGAEGALVYLGTASADGTFLAIPTTADAYAGGLELAATGTIPVTDEFGVTGKLGGLFWGVRSETGLGFDRDDTGVSFAMGAGLKYDITKHVGIRLEWERFWQVGNSTIGESDIDMFTIGGLYRF